MVEVKEGSSVAVSLVHVRLLTGKEPHTQKDSHLKISGQSKAREYPHKTPQDLQSNDQEARFLESSQKDSLAVNHRRGSGQTVPYHAQVS